VDRPTFRRQRVKYLDDDQAVALLRLLAGVESLSYRCAVLLALTCGLRLGEVDGLTWADVDFKRCAIDISKALKYTGRTGTFVGDTKTVDSERDITLPAGMMALLDQTRRQHDEIARLLGDRWRGVGRIVCAWDGTPLHHDTVSKWFRRFALTHGFDVTFHQLRHTHATLLFANNIDAVAVASRLGHKDASTTLRIYAHALKRRDADSAAAMQTILDRADAQDDAQDDAGPDD
jgi:integrase